jgi:superoxide reductase
MAEKLQIYKCEICGNIVEVLHGGKGQLVCCGKPMQLLEVKETEEGNEKHLPVIERVDAGINVKVGSIAHPMEEKHHIEWIEVITKDDRAYKKFLKTGDTPAAEFGIRYEEVNSVREHCNIHGLWAK